MSDAATPEPVSPTEDTVPGADAPAAAVATAPAPAAPSAPAPAETTASSRRSVAVPVWLLGLAAVLVLVVGAFFVGRETAPKTSGPTSLADAAQQSARGDLPVGNLDAQQLLDALRQNPNLDLGILGNILRDLGNGSRGR